MAALGPRTSAKQGSSTSVWESRVEPQVQILPVATQDAREGGGTYETICDSGQCWEA